MRKILLVLALALAAGAAQADDSTFYIGAGISRNQLNGISNAGIDYSHISKTSWKAFVGFRPISVVAGELDYIDLGSDSSAFISGPTSSNAKAFAGYAVGFLPIPLPFLDVYGKAGLARWKLSGNSSGPLFSFSSNGTSFAWGGGVQVHVGNIGARLEYENFNIRNTSGAGVVSLSVMLNVF
jgi:opacity protein-like surface antigen